MIANVIAALALASVAACAMAGFAIMFGILH
jgi:hypothetical protein